MGTGGCCPIMDTNNVARFLSLIQKWKFHFLSTSLIDGLSVYFVERQCGKSARAPDFDACECAHPTTTKTRTYAQGAVSLIYLIAFSFRMLDLRLSLFCSLLLYVFVMSWWDQETFLGGSCCLPILNEQAWLAVQLGPLIKLLFLSSSLMIGLLMRWWTSFSRITKVGASFLAGSTVYGTKCQLYKWVFVFSFWIFAPMGTPQVESCSWKWLCFCEGIQDSHGMDVCRLPQIHQEIRQRKVLYMGLYLLIWGEAANLRFMPECLCYIYHHVSSCSVSLLFCSNRLFSTLHPNCTTVGCAWKGLNSLISYS